MTSRSVRALAATEVLVVGEGLPALAASVRAARSGRRVLMVAAGTTFASEITLAHFGALAALSSKWLQDLFLKIQAANGVQRGWWDPAITELCVDEFLEREGIEVLMYAVPVALVPQSPTHCCGVLFGSKEGLLHVPASCVVDATTQGALFHQSGVEFQTPTSFHGSRTLTFEFCDREAPASVQFSCEGFQCRSFRTWDDQVCVTMEGSAGNLTGLERLSRLAIPRVARESIRQIPALHEAVLSVSGHTLLLTSGRFLVAPDNKHPRYENVWGVGPWVHNAGWGNLAALAKMGDTWEFGQMAATPNGSAVPFWTPEPEVVNVDVAVVGGGTAGGIASIAAALEDVQTLLCETGHFLGGIGTGGGIHSYYYGVSGGLQDRLDALTSEYAAMMGRPERVTGFHPEAKKCALEALAAEAGVEIWYGCVIFDLVMEEGRVAALFAARPGGLFEIRASATVDSSGDGDVCAAAGAQFTMGRESDGICNFFSLIPGIRKEGRCGFLNFDGGIVDPTSIQDLTRARRLGLSHLRRPEGFTAENRYNYISPMVGLRQSRQIIADYVLTVDDQVVMRHFPDTIAYGSCHLDDHRKDFHNASDQMVFWHWGLGFWDRWIVHELPLRSLLPKNVDGLLVACRALGVTSEAASLFRMQRDMQRVGEAAGVTAALASKQGVTPRGVDVSSVQETLRSRGGMRHIHELWKNQTDPRWANSVYREDLPVDSYPSAQELALRLERSWGSIVLWQLCHDPDHGPALLEEVLLAGGPHARWWASCGLAMLGNPAGAEVLLQTLEARDSTLPLPPDFPVWHDGWKEHTAPRWLVAAVLLGVLRCRRAVTPIAGLLSPRENTPVFGCKEDAEIRCGAAVRALGRIGDSSAEPALREFLKNSEHHSHTHGFSRGGEWLRSGVGFDIGWSLRLAAIEALTKIGVPSPEAAAAFLTHPEPTARRYAEKVYRSAKLALEPLSSAA